MSWENVEIVRRVINEFTETRQLSLVSPELVWHGLNGPVDRSFTATMASGSLLPREGSARVAGTLRGLGARAQCP
jgi:hypothetical protein